MKVKCIYAGNIKTLENDKIYSIAFLTKNNVKLLDKYARLNYSIKRFNIIQNGVEIPLSEYVSNFDKTNIYQSNRITYNLSKNGYLIAFRNGINGVNENDIFKVLSFTKNYFGATILTMFNVITKYRICIEYSKISSYFYNIDDYEVLSILRMQKLQKIKNRKNI